jgi:hypothetical protein
MVYHTVCILLCVPFLKPHSNSSSVGNPTDHQMDQNSDDKELETACMQKARTICSSSAQRICVVAQKYRQIFGSFKMSPITPTHSMLSAALIIIEDCCADPATKPRPGNQALRGPSPQASVGLCLQVLRELSTSGNIAKRIGRNLEKVYCQRFNCDVDHMPPAPSLAFDGACMTSYQSTEAAVHDGATDLAYAPVNGLLDPNDLLVQNDISTPPFANINWFDVPSSRNMHDDHTHDTIGYESAHNPDELFLNNLGFAFSADCLPSDYNMFDTLNQMYLEEIW